MLTKEQVLFAGLEDFNLTEENYVEKIEEFISSVSDLVKYLPITILSGKELRRDSLNEYGLIITGFNEKDLSDFKKLLVLSELDFELLTKSLDKQVKENPNSGYSKVTSSQNTGRLSFYFKEPKRHTDSRVFSFFSSYLSSLREFVSDDDSVFILNKRFNSEISIESLSLLQAYKYISIEIHSFNVSIRRLSSDFGAFENCIFNPIYITDSFAKFFIEFYIYKMLTSESFKINNLRIKNLIHGVNKMEQLANIIISTNIKHVNVFNRHNEILEKEVKRYGIEKMYKKTILTNSLKQ